MSTTPQPPPDAARPPAASPTTGGSSAGALRRHATTPIVLALVCLGLYAWVQSQELLQREVAILNADRIAEEFLAHLRLTGVATLMVLVIAIPLGVVLTRPFARRIRPVALGLANIGQAVPSFGVLVLFAVVWDIGFTPAVVAFIAYAILPVLRNTMVGLEQVDGAVIDAARGMGLSRGQVLRRIELPLAVPVMVAGIRTALVIVVGTAALATFVAGGGLGDLINNGIKLDSEPVLLTGAILTAVLALAVDWLGGIAEELLRPRGL